jgi:ribosomal protein S18 acetylase RimI-like enzyme
MRTGVADLLSAVPDSRVSSRVYTREIAGDFAALLLESNEGSLDCPELAGSRTDEEQLEGHQLDATGRFQHRLLVACGGESVGVLVTERGIEVDAMDLSYLGVVPAQRGRGFGRAMVRLALVIAAQEGAKVLGLSVDARNEPAIRLYSRSGFIETGRREVYLRHW